MGACKARQIGMRMLMVLGWDILLQEFSRRARLKVGIMFRRSRLLSRLIRNHEGFLFLGAASRPSGPPALMPWPPQRRGGLDTIEAGR